MKFTLYKVSNFSALLWFLSVVVVMAILAFATKLATHDPDFSPGDPENIYLIPMLLFFFIGTFAFMSMIGAGTISKFIKEKTDQIPFFGLSNKKIITFTGVIILLAFSFLFGMRQANIASATQEVTGQEVFDSVNQYRESKGLKAVTLEPMICDNLVQRYLDLKNPDNKYVGHAGFEEWIKKQNFPEIYELSEIYATGVHTGGAAVRFWDTSPGHRSSLIGDYEYGCAYGNDDTAIMIFGKKLSQ